LKPNILFIVIDSFRADKFYGKNKTSVTPNIDYIIKNGTYFNQTIGGADATLLSWAGIFTGKFPFKTGIRSLRFKKLNEETTSYFTHLKNEGYHFNAYVPAVSNTIGLFPKFENDDYDYDYYWNLSDGLGKKIINLLESKNMNEPWLYYIHIEDLHFPITLTREFDNEKFGITKYDRKVSCIDYWIGKIIKKIDLTNTILVITADHGTYIKSITKNGKQIDLEVNGELQTHVRNLGNLIPKPFQSLKSKLFFFLENIRKKRKYAKIKDLDLKPHEQRALLSQRGDLEHFLYDEHVHIPLLFAGYGIPKDMIINQLVRSVDIFPTLSDLANLPKMNNTDGRSLKPHFEGKSMDELPAYMESTPLIELKTKDVIGVRTSTYKYFRDKEDSTKRVFLYNVKQDPFEDNNLAQLNLEIVHEMEGILQKILQNKSSIPIDEVNEEETKKIEDELKKLGYI
jgi:arylsulfatase A-like enzyme|tara:strand:- start:757 stop:2121 length:1365 start_codon:yes stop_codon:yes gene_type:complete